MSAPLAGILSLVIGLAVCFLGYPLFRVLLPLAGLVFGYAFGASLVGPGHWLPAVITGVAVAVIVGGAILGFGFAWTLGAGYFVPGPTLTIIAVATAVLFAVLFALLRKPAIMFCTASGGAGAAVYGLGLLFPSLGFDTRPNIIATVVIMVLAVGGFLVQYSAHRARDLYKDIGY
jgi:hypothetical protein